MACEACENALGGDAAVLLPWHGTRISVVACERHITEMRNAFTLLNAFYDASYQEAVTELTSTLLALHKENN
jgi:hypothetical protein